jgi:hypothetical protein
VKRESAEWFQLELELISLQASRDQTLKTREANQLRTREKLMRKTADVFGGDFATAAHGRPFTHRAGDWKHPALTADDLAHAQQQFLRTIQTFATSLAPNYAGGRTSNVEIHQHFPSAPTDQHREAKYAQWANRFGWD